MDDWLERQFGEGFAFGFFMGFGVCLVVVLAW